MTLDYGNFQVIMNENTGNWIALENKGFEIYSTYAGLSDYPTAEIEEFVRNIDSHLEHINSFEDSEKGLSVLLTNMCNFSCLHCYYSSSYTQPKMLEFNESYKDFISNCVADGFKWICFSGGEPLLNKSFEKFIINAAENGLHISVLTNGSLVDEKIAKLFSDYNVSVQVSLDGTGDVYETIRCGSKYSKTLRGLKLLSMYDVGTDISFLPAKLTIPDYENVVRIAQEYGVKSIHMPFLEIYGRAVENYERLHISHQELFSFMELVIDDYFDGKYNGIKIGFIENLMGQLLHPNVQISCRACREMILGIDYNERVYPCSELIMDEYCIGTIQESLPELRKNFRKRLCNISSASVNRIEKCSLCPFKVLCGGGCRVQALIAGDVLQEDKYCEVLKKLYTKILEKIVVYDIDA